MPRRGYHRGVSDAPDIVVVGGGIIGLASAYALAEAGARVEIIDAKDVGREASWAGGGILSPIHPHGYPAALADLAERSLALYPSLCEELEAATGAGVEMRRSGLLFVAFDDEDDRECAAIAEWRRARGLPTESLTGEAARAVEPSLAPAVRSALRLPDVLQVRNPRLLKALAHACARLGVRIRPHVPAIGFRARGERLEAVVTAAGDIATRSAVLAAGSWSGPLARSFGLDLPVAPKKGQMLLLRDLRPPLGHIVVSKDQYLIPRGDGRVLLGSTVEDAGFDKAVTGEAVRFLLARGEAFCPAVAKAVFETAWAGLRPGSPDRLPFIGSAPGAEGLVVATGHFRNGLLLAPATAEAVRDLLAGRAPSIPLDPFRIDR